jgi:hypothetical protein
MATSPGRELLNWGAAGTRLLRTMRLEAARSGHAEVQPAHLLLAVLDQTEMHRGLRAIGVQPDVYAMRAIVGAASLAPEEFREDLPLSVAAEELLTDIRPHEEDEPYDLLYPLALKAALEREANRMLLLRTGLDPALLDPILDRIQ